MNKLGRFLITAVITLTMVTLISCVKDTSGVCGASCTISFTYTFNADSKERLREEVTDVYLYLFDEAGYFYSSSVFDVSQLDDARSVILDLDPGEYTAVAWGNLLSDSYAVTGGDATRDLTRTAMAVQLITDPNGEVNGTTTDLFHGMVSVSASRTGENRARVSFVKNTNNINVLLEPSDKTRAPGEDVRASITSTNGALNFDNTKAATEPTTYKPNYSMTLYNGKAYDLARFKVMRLETGDDTTLRIYLDNQLNQSESLTDLILQYFPHITTDQDLDRYSDYTFVYRYDAGTGLYVLTSISVKDWTETVERPGGI